MIRIKIHKSQQATMSGLHYDDLRSILTGASLDFYESLKKAQKKNDLEAIEWYQYMLKVIDCTKSAMDLAIQNTYPPRTTTLTKKQRWAKVREEKKERQLLDQILFDIRFAQAKQVADAVQVEDKFYYPSGSDHAEEFAKDSRYLEVSPADFTDKVIQSLKEKK